MNPRPALLRRLRCAPGSLLHSCCFEILDFESERKKHRHGGAQPATPHNNNNTFENKDTKLHTPANKNVLSNRTSNDVVTVAPSRGLSSLLLFPLGTVAGPPVLKSPEIIAVILMRARLQQTPLHWGNGTFGFRGPSLRRDRAATSGRLRVPVPATSKHTLVRFVSLRTPALHSRKVRLCPSDTVLLVRILCTTLAQATRAIGSCP